MRVIVLIIVAPLALALALYAARTQGGLVATLRTWDIEGRTFESRVWVARDGEHLWIRATQSVRPWLDRAINHPEVELDYLGEVHRYQAAVLPQQRGRVNALMAEQYGWSEWLISRFEDRAQAVPVRLSRIYE